MGRTYLKEPAPWEQKSKYFRNVRSGYLENIQQNIDMLIEGARSLVEIRVKSAKSIFISPDMK